MASVRLQAEAIPHRPNWESSVEGVTLVTASPPAPV
jgi:hypothetical protein